jgi:hypothetical protein
MGTTLTGKIVAETYDSLLKVTDNNTITGTKKRITDGFGNDTPLLLSSTDVQIDGNLLLPGTTAQYVRGDGSFATFTDVGLTSVGITLGSTGTDANVSGSPLTANGAITLNLPTASATNRGLLSAANWTTFNNKENALTFSAPLSRATNTISIPAATTSVSGHLTSTDWNTFNNKVSTSRTLTINGTTFDLSANRSWTIADTGLTSVGISMPTAFSVSNSPLTANGTIAITGAGTAAQYIDGTGSLQTFPTFLSADKLITEVYNSSGATLTKGTIVYINGTQGNLPTIAKALATGDSTSAQTFGFVQTDITNMNNGYVIVAGKLTDLDTSAYTGGTQLYLSPTTAGTYTSTKQYAPNHLVYVGIVVRAHPTQGSIEVKIQNGYELDELHDVIAQTPSNNDGIFYNSTSTKWENKSVATALGFTPLSGSGTTNYVPKFSGSTSIANSLIYDTGTTIGIGTTSPSATLDVYRATTLESSLQLSSGTDYARLFFRDTDDNFGMFINGLTRWRFVGSTGNAALLESGSGNVAIGTTAATATTKLWVAGTGYFSDSVGIGSSSLTQYNLRISKNITGATTSAGIYQDSTIQSGVTSHALLFWTTPSTQATAFTLTTLSHFNATQGTFGAGSVVTTQQGFVAGSNLIGATNNYGFRGLIPSGTNRWNLYLDGTANNYINGALGIGSTSLTARNLVLDRTITGSTTGISLLNGGTIASDVTGDGTYFRSIASTQAASFVLSDLYHFRATQGTFGAGSAVVNQYGFHATSNLIGATFDYGFYGDLPSATGVWNVYMNGAAPNYFNGNVGIGTNAITGYKLNVAGNLNLLNNAYHYIGENKAFLGDGSTLLTLFSGTTALTIKNNADASELVRITNGGNVGIGTTSPNAKLVVSNGGVAGMEVSPGSASASNGTLIEHYNRSTAAYVQSRTIASSHIFDGGNVGIGTTSPGGLLDINSSTGNDRLLLSHSGSVKAALGVTTAGVAYMYHHTSSTFPMWVSATGNVGIGNNSPSAKLDVAGSIVASGTLGLTSDSTEQIVIKTLTDTNRQLLIGYNYSSNQSVIQSVQQGVSYRNIALNPNGGNVLVGLATDNSTTAKLQVGGGISYQNIFNTQTASYTLALTDQSKIVETNVGSANNVTIPLDSSVNFPIGTEIQVLQLGAGQTTIVATSGVTTRSKSNQLKIANQNTGVTLVKRAANDWYVIGNLTA